MAVISDRICVPTFRLNLPQFVPQCSNVVWERGILSLNESSLHRRDYSVIRQRHLSLILVGMEVESTGSPLLVQQQVASSRRRGNGSTFARRLPESCVFVLLQTSGLVHKKKSREYAIIEWCTRPDTRQTKLLALILHLSYKTRVKLLPFITILLNYLKFC